MARRPQRPAPSGRAGAGRGAAGAAPPGPDARLVVLGEFGRAHGLQGEVRLKSYTAEPMAIGGYGPLLASDGRVVELTALRPAAGTPDILVARVAGVAGRSAAEGLNRLTLSVPRDRLGAPEDEDEFFTADLVGLAAVDAAGTRLGTIRAVPNYGGGDLLEIEPEGGGRPALLPFTRLFVPKVEIAAGRVTIAPPEDLFAPPGPPPEGEG